jgi:Zn finger protein HypA/HybF involved in hydrogenase expression
METVTDRCPCGSAEIEVQSGREMRIATLELQ